MAAHRSRSVPPAAGSSRALGDQRADRGPEAHRLAPVPARRPHGPRLLTFWPPPFCRGASSADRARSTPRRRSCLSLRREAEVQVPEAGQALHGRCEEPCGRSTKTATPNASSSTAKRITDICWCTAAQGRPAHPGRFPHGRRLSPPAAGGTSRPQAGGEFTGHVHRAIMPGRFWSGSYCAGTCGGPPLQSVKDCKTSSAPTEHGTVAELSKRPCGAPRRRVLDRVPSPRERGDSLRRRGMAVLI